MATAYEDALQMAASLSPDDQLRLLRELMALTATSDPARAMELRRRLAEIDWNVDAYLLLLRQMATMHIGLWGVPAAASASSSEPASVLELEGLGAEIWQGIDAQEYVTGERSSWRG